MSEQYKRKNKEELFVIVDGQRVHVSWLEDLFKEEEE
jgi:hypothetical protein|tara:strand:+ start:1591 stop:1701 length:111 start_codon:yes stop_codon:yes gene_type:complete